MSIQRGVIEPMRSWMRPTLTRKFIALLLGFLLLQGVQLGGGILGLYHLDEQGELINRAWQQRTQLTTMVLQARVLLEYESPNDDLLSDWALALVHYDRFLDSLEQFLHSRQERLISPLGRKSAIHRLRSLRNDWQGQLRPLADDLDRVPIADRQRLVNAIELVVPAQLAELDALIHQLEENMRVDTRRLAYFQTVVLALSLLLGIVGLVMARRIVTLPMARLIDATRAIADGAYDRRIAVRSHDEIGILGATFNQMASAVGEHTARIAALNEAAVRITAAQSIDDLLRQILAGGRALADTSLAVIGLYDPDQDAITHWAQRRFDSATEEQPDEVVRDYARQLLMEKIDAPRQAAVHASTTLADWARTAGVQTCLCLPLLGSRGALGMMMFFRAGEGEYSITESDLLASLSRIAAGAVETTQLRHKAQALATTDSLTGLANRRLFNERLADEFQRAKRYHGTLSLLMVDIDRFKAVNDRYGHLAGDEVLKQLARILARAMRDVDSAARYGGEEFAAILPQTDQAGALVIAERVRTTVQESRFDLGTGDAIRVTVSIGVGVLDHALERPEELTARADTGLYRAKKSGRNRVEIGEEA